ncbi:magnesium transporter [Thioalkalivibrio sp. XN279]|uniref:magnesium transporter n=1 Tax=Thioalkalivibrio sp. XN279 TaxID=2714953 RepID=UPI00140B7FEB|nr:magnesium transporter [Thioalkalivibrio sp. XN279]NHA13947.1 magnesium transporter [Thioalkalivibrio sp. XN279]
MQQPEHSEDVAEVLEEITPEQWQVIRAAIAAEDALALKTALEPVHPADIADLLEQLDSEQRTTFLRLYASEFEGDILSEIDESIREEVIEVLPPEVLAEAVRELDSDDLVDILEDLEQPERDFILDSLESEDREAVQSAMAWPEGSAGRLMQVETVTAPEHFSVGEMIDYLRSAEWLPDQFYHIILVDPDGHPTGYATLGRVLASRRDVLLKDITEESFRTVKAAEDEAEVAHLFNKYHLISMPVTDESGQLVGVITIDDAMNVLDEELEEDILRLAGVSEESSLSDRIWDTTRGRFIWLFINLLTAIFASFVISLFEEELEAMVALAVLMPIVASMGGNAGTQSMTVAVRALATRELTGQNARRVLWREVVVGVLNGGAFGMIMSLVVAYWFGVPMLAAVIAMAMMLTLAAAAFAGIVLPLALDKLGVDPALASGPFVTTVTDVVGFFAFLGLASLVLL